MKLKITHHLQLITKLGCQPPKPPLSAYYYPHLNESVLCFTENSDFRKYPHTAPLERVSRTHLGYKHRTPLECKALLPM